MTTVILFHSALGLRPAIKRFADRLRDHGHDVVTPDLFAGHVFDDLDAGVAHRDAIGIPELAARASAAVDDQPTDVVYAGMSMGAASATHLALTRPGARGVILLHGLVPPQAFGLASWPPDLPVLVHRTADDPWVEDEFVDLFHAAIGDAVLEEHVHPGASHLFTDEDLAEHEPDTTEDVVASVLAWLASLDDRDVSGGASAHG